MVPHGQIQFFDTIKCELALAWNNNVALPHSATVPELIC